MFIHTARQAIGVYWMLQQERKRVCQGGILGDEMGLGKVSGKASTHSQLTLQTIEALALIIANPSKNPDIIATLVVAPLPLISQWQSEIGKHTSLRSMVYHGNLRFITAETLKHFDVVLTTYDIVSSEGQGLLVRCHPKCRGLY